VPWDFTAPLLMMVLYLAMIEIYFHFFGHNALRSLVRHQRDVNFFLKFSLVTMRCGISFATSVM
jgi:hypothetical protein